MAKKQLFKNARGYRAELIAEDSERVVYACWDEKGVLIENRLSRAPVDFHRDWKHI